MRICCDQNVARKYVETFERTHWTSTTVASALDPGASDAEIASFARTNDWVVFTSDDDFYVHADSHGLLVYSQVEDPDPGVVRDAIAAIDAAYDRPAAITNHGIYSQTHWGGVRLLPSDARPVDVQPG